MSSEARIRSSRANGALSRGPKTPEGRARSAAARRTHGLTSSQIVLENESQDEFRALRQAYLDHCQPQSPAERGCIEQLVAAVWRLKRIQAIETNLINQEIERQAPAVAQEFGPCDSQIGLALAFRSLVDDGGALVTLQRHEARLNHLRNRAEKTLEMFRAARLRRQSAKNATSKTSL